MQLTCPQCSAKYNVADAAIPPSGRTVRCAACGHSWLARPAGAIHYADKSGSDSGLRPRPAASTAKAVDAAAKKGLLAKLGLGKRAQKPKLEPHELARKKALDQIRNTHRLAAAIPWLLSLAVLGGVLGAAVMYRTDIVRAWPKAATAFSLIGLPANLYGVDIANVTVTSTLDAKGPKVEVRGVLKSVSRTPEFIPYLKVALVDAKGIEKLSWMVDPGIETLQPGKSHAFMSARSNPVRGNLKAVIMFADPPRKGPKPPAARALPAADKPHGKAPEPMPVEGAGHDLAPGEEIDNHGAPLTSR